MSTLLKQALKAGAFLIRFITPLRLILALGLYFISKILKFLIPNVIRPAKSHDDAIEQPDEGKLFPVANNPTDASTIIIGIGGNGYTFANGEKFAGNRQAFIQTFQDGLFCYKAAVKGHPLSIPDYSDYKLYYLQPGYLSTADECVDQIVQYVTSFAFWI